MDIEEGVSASLTQTRCCHSCSRLARCCVSAPSPLKGFDRVGAICDATRDMVCITRSHWLPANIPANDLCAPCSVWRLQGTRNQCGGFPGDSAIRTAIRDMVCITASHWLPATIPANDRCARCGGSRTASHHDASAALRPFPNTQSASPTPTRSSSTHTHTHIDAKRNIRSCIFPHDGSIAFLRPFSDIPLDLHR
jgi:hypothetical protein